MKPLSNRNSQNSIQKLISAIKGEPLTVKYDGYTSCPIVTGYGKLVLADKAYALPRLYWHGMLRGFG